MVFLCLGVQQLFNPVVLVLDLVDQVLVVQLVIQAGVFLLKRDTVGADLFLKLLLLGLDGVCTLFLLKSYPRVHLRKRLLVLLLLLLDLVLELLDDALLLVVLGFELAVLLNLLVDALDLRVQLVLYFLVGLLDARELAHLLVQLEPVLHELVLQLQIKKCALGVHSRWPWTVSPKTPGCSAAKSAHALFRGFRSELPPSAAGF